MADRRGRSTTRSKSKDNVNDPRNWTNAKLRSKLQDLGIQTTVNFSRTVLVELYLINRKQRITTTATATTTRPGPTPIYPAVKTAKNTDDSTTDLPTVKILEKIYTAVIGDQVKLECSISGISQKTTVSWQRILPEGQTVTLDIDEIKYTVSKLNDPHLVINDIMKTDEGDYVFTISSVNGERKSARTKLKVNGGPPILNMKPKRHYKTEGDTAILKVNVIAEPPATNLTWTKNEGGREHLIANDNDKYLGGVLGSPSLIIAETEKSYDEGKYTCEAENHAGQGSNSVHLTIEKKYENTETDETTQNEGITERIKFRHAQMVNTLSKFIYPKANHWAQFIELAKAYVPNSELGEDLHHIISYLMQMDHISYGKYTKLFQIVNEIDKEAALIIKKAEADIETITKGGRTTETTAELECRFEGNYNPDLPQPCICQIKEQYRDVEGRIKGSGCEGSIVLKFTISEAQTLLQPSALYLAVTLRTRLENRKIVLKDESNEPLVLQTTPKVTIPTDNPKDIPTIRLSKGHYRFTEGKDVILKCVVVATVDTESIQWFRVKDGNSHAICIDNNKYFGGLSNSPSLAIADVKKSDRGIYFCKAKNSAGEVESDIAFVEIRTIGDLETRTADGSAEKRSVMEDTGGVKEDTGGVKEDTGGVKEDTGGVMKDTVGVMEDTGGVMEDLGGVMEDTGGVKEDTGGVKEDTGGVMEDTGGVMKDTVGVMKDTGGVMEDLGGVMEDTGGVMEDTGGVMKDTVGVMEDTGGVMEDTGGVMKDTGGVMEDTGVVIEDTGGVMEDTGGMMKDTVGVMKDTGGVTEDTGGVMKDTGGVMKDTGYLMKDTDGVTKDTDGVIKDTDGVMKDIRDVMEDTGDVMEDTGGEMKDTGGVMEETRGLMKDTSDVIEDTGGVMKDTGAVKNLGNMKVDVVKEELSSGLEVKAGIKDDGFNEEFVEHCLYRSLPSTWPHPTLKMGCNIGRLTPQYNVQGTLLPNPGGTLGPFVKHNNNLGFLTCAHVLFDIPSPTYTLDFTASVTNQVEVVQPSTYGNQFQGGVACGVVERAIFDPTRRPSIDAAVVRLTDLARVPSVGQFSNELYSSYRNAGFNELTEYNNGAMLSVADVDNLSSSQIVVKFGSKSDVTKGSLRVFGAKVRPLSTALGLPSGVGDVVMKDQYQVIGTYPSANFCEKGDAGSGVFCKDLNGMLHCVGMAIGSANVGDYQYRVGVVTPIEAVLQALGPNVTLATFP